MREWFRRYLLWLRESANGKDEARSENNHGTWYDVQAASIALYVGETEFAKTIIEESKEKRIARQIEPDGTQPLELERTRSLSYSMLNLKGLATLAALGERAGVDLWHYKTKDGRSIQRALDYLLDYFTGEQEWKEQQITNVNTVEIYPLLLEAGRMYHDKKYYEVAQKIPNIDVSSNRATLTIGNQLVQ